MGQGVWSPVPCGTVSLTQVSAQDGRQSEGAHVDTVRGVESSGWKVTNFSELGVEWPQGLKPRRLRRWGKQVVHLDASGARLNGCEWNNLPATFSICGSMLR